MITTVMTTTADTDTTSDSSAAPMSTAEASRYQQLRGHLTTLNLATAAEQLPGVLAPPAPRTSR